MSKRNFMATEKMKITDALVNKKDIPKIYRSIAPIYDLWGTLTETKARKRCLDLAQINNGENILEVAVGTGAAFAEILKKNQSGRNNGIDLTNEMLGRAKKKAQKSGLNNYHLALGDAYNLAYDNDSFDLVFNNYMFDLLPERDFPVVLNEFKRVLRPGGRLLMANMTKSMHWYNSIWEVVYGLSPELLGGCRGVCLLPYIESAGFINTKREFISQMTFPTEIICGMKPDSM
jgi:ubiquinone/menaquinone biosynthesis C-methylase UbiE